MITKNLKQHGGARPGSGRPHAKANIAAEKAREYVMIRIAEKIGDLIDTQIDNALGMRYEDADGRIYTKAPDMKTNEYLVNQLIGKAKETNEITGKNGASLVFMPVELLVKHNLQQKKEEESNL